MKKGSIVRGRVERLEYPNRGIVLTDDAEVLEVKDVIPGQIVEAVVTRGRKGASKGRVRAIVKRAPAERLESICPLTGRCGGCSYQTLPYEEQLKLKEGQVRQLLSRHIMGLEGQQAVPDGSSSGQYSPDQAAGMTGQDVAENICANTCAADEPDAMTGRLDFADNSAAEHGQAARDAFVWEGIIPSPKSSGFRNKMEFTFGDEYPGGPMTLGMHVKNSFYDIVTVDCCSIIDEDYRSIVRNTLDFFVSRNIPHYNKKTRIGILRYLIVRKAVYTGEIMVVLITSNAEAGGQDDLYRDFAEALLKLPLEGRIASVWHGISDSVADTAYCENLELICGKPSITEKVLGLSFEITPYSFFQTNTFGAEVLYSKVREYVLAAQKMEADRRPGRVASEGGDGDACSMRIFDLYSGTGTIAQVLSPAAKEIIGVEIVGEAVEAARKNAERNGLDNCSFICGDVFKTLDSLPQGPDIVILDPPREGVHPKAMERIAEEFAPPYIVYVSCKATSFMENLAIMTSHGYRPVKGCCVDMFPATAHVEVVSLLQKMSNTRERTITLDVEMEDYHRIKNRTGVTADVTE